MSDRSVRDALRSDEPLVLIEAPAGCGKTFQGADYAQEAASAGYHPLILTHTHAACSVFHDRTKDAGKRVSVRTIDSTIANIASTYHAGLGLSRDTGAWIRQRQDGHGHAEVAHRVAKLVDRYPMVAACLAERHRLVVCDEHQDSSGDQHALVLALLQQGARVRIFADPMQKIFRDKALPAHTKPWNWADLSEKANAVEHLDTPHRWLRAAGCAQLGEWTLSARAALRAGKNVDLRGALPPSVRVVFAENQAKRYGEYQLSAGDRRAIDAFENAEKSLLILTRSPETARSFRGFFNRRIPLWEGHVRNALETLAGAVRLGTGDPVALASAIVGFMGNVGKGFTASEFGRILEKEAREGCKNTRTGKPAKIQELARLLVEEPDHRGVGKALERIAQLNADAIGFKGIEVDCKKEFWDAVRMGAFDEIDAALAEITRQRTHARHQPPSRAISTIYKAKGLETDSVIVMPCDSGTFPDKDDARCLLYVALSRARSRLLLVVSRSKPSPLLAV